MHFWRLYKLVFDICWSLTEYVNYNILIIKNTLFAFIFIPTTIKVCMLNSKYLWPKSKTIVPYSLTEGNLDLSQSNFANCNYLPLMCLVLQKSIVAYTLPVHPIQFDVPIFYSKNYYIHNLFLNTKYSSFRACFFFNFENSLA